MPAVIDSAANTKQAKGSALLIRPSSSKGRQALRASARPPRHASSGSSTRLARPTRSAVIGMGPKSCAPRRMNRKEPPQMAASRIRSRMSRGFMLLQLQEGLLSLDAAGITR